MHMPKQSNMQNRSQKSDRSLKMLVWKLTFIRLVSYKNLFFKNHMGHREVSEDVVADWKMSKIACRRTHIFLKKGIRP